MTTRMIVQYRSEMKEKKCFRCGEDKPLSAFYKHKQIADGHLNKCKECTKKDVQENYRSNIDHYTEYERERYCREERKQQAATYQRNRRKRNPEKYQAHNAVNNAMRDGRLERQPCEVCGSLISQAHHDDYSKPLDVRWLCFKHHREVHGQETH